MDKKTALWGGQLSPPFQVKKGKSWVYNAHCLNTELPLARSWCK